MDRNWMTTAVCLLLASLWGQQVLGQEAPENTPPVAYLSGPTSVEIGQLATYDASATIDQQDPNSALTFRYNWGDGTPESVGTGLQW